MIAMATGKILCITLDPGLEEEMLMAMKEDGSHSADRFISDILQVHFTSRKSPHDSPETIQAENEHLRLRIRDLEHIISKKDDEITVLLKLWETCGTDRDRSPELEEKVEKLIRDWYYETERKDYSAADRRIP
jgi:hypothetical protein